MKTVTSIGTKNTFISSVPTVMPRTARAISGTLKWVIKTRWFVVIKDAGK